MKKTHKRLALRVETIRFLMQDQLKELGGGRVLPAGAPNCEPTDVYSACKPG
jgi:hypothetical protein